MTIDYKKQGKKNRASGRAFELKVRKDLEKSGWTVAKWTNNVQILESMNLEPPKKLYSIIPAKHKFNPFGRTMALGTGFPDFIAFREIILDDRLKSIMKATTADDIEVERHTPFMILGVECKSNGQLNKVEKEKCKWLIDNKIFSNILIAKKGLKRGAIEYNEFR